MINSGLFYSCDKKGFGHFSRTYKIIKHLQILYPDLVSDLLTNKLPFPINTDQNLDITLMPETSLEDNLEELVRLWSRFLLERIKNKNPNFLYVDLLYWGGYGELNSVIPKIQGQTKTILGLRDILDSESETIRKWFSTQEGPLTVNDYDKIAIFGDEEIFFDLYPNIEIDRNKVSFPGYLIDKQNINSNLSNREIDLVAMFGGGGKSGKDLEYLLSVLKLLPRDISIKVVAGPFFDQAHLFALKNKYIFNSNIEIIDKEKDIPSLLGKTKAVVTHSGYNSVMESLESGANVLLFPRREGKKKEQVIRARIFEEKGICSYIDPKIHTQKEVLQRICFSIYGNSISNPKILRSAYESGGLENVFSRDFIQR